MPDLIRRPCVHARRYQPAEILVAQLLLRRKRRIHLPHCRRVPLQPLKRLHLPRALRLPQPLVLLPQPPEPSVQNLLHPRVEFLLAAPADQRLKVLPGVGRRGILSFARSLRRGLALGK